jgi:hypothetical protein
VVDWRCPEARKGRAVDVTEAGSIVTKRERRVSVARREGYVCDECEEAIMFACVLVDLLRNGEVAITFAYHPRCYDEAGE